MADGYIGEIRIFTYGYAPLGWLDCSGQILNIREYQGLYGVIGNIYGGSPPNTFALPNLQGYVPVGMGQGTGLSSYTLGPKYGASTATVSGTQLPSHSHGITIMMGKDDPSGEGNAVFLSDPTNANWNLPASRSNSTANYLPVAGYATAASADTYMAPATLSMSGGGSTGTALAHNNEQSYLALRFCICWNGVFPIHS